MAEPQPAAAPAPAAGTGQQDALDKGISQVLNKSGHGQSNSTVEKISDGFRKIFKKVSGKDVPIADKQ